MLYSDRVRISLIVCRYEVTGSKYVPENNIFAQSERRSRLKRIEWCYMCEICLDERIVEGACGGVCVGMVVSAVQFMLY